MKSVITGFLPNGSRTIAGGIVERKSLSANHIRTSGQGRDRTGDTRIFSPLLYQLSYLSGRRSSLGGQQDVTSPYS